MSALLSPGAKFRLALENNKPLSWFTLAVNFRGCQFQSNALLGLLSNVRFINLSKCRNITDAGLMHLPNVKEIDLRNTSVSNQKRNELKEKGITVYG